MKCPFWWSRTFFSSICLPTLIHADLIAFVCCGYCNRIIVLAEIGLVPERFACVTTRKGEIGRRRRRRRRLEELRECEGDGVVSSSSNGAVNLISSECALPTPNTGAKRV